MLLVVALVALCYFGGNYCPAVLRQNKKILLGVAVGLVLCSFMGLRLEGVALQPAGAPDCSRSEIIDSPATSPFRPEACGGTMDDNLFCEHAPNLCQ